VEFKFFDPSLSECGFIVELQKMSGCICLHDIVYTYLREPNVLLMASQDAEWISGKFKVTKKVALVFTVRRSYASGVLEVVILSVYLSVRLSHACFVANAKNLPAIFLYHMKGQSF